MADPPASDELAVEVDEPERGGDVELVVELPRAGAELVAE
jgi:hypothetical protein